MSRVKHVFGHGLGDAVQFTAVLQHLAKFRPGTVHDVFSLPGKHSAFTGLCRASRPIGDPDGGPYDQVVDHAWPECGVCYADSPSTKTALCLREVFGLTPRQHLLRYRVDVGDQARVRAREYAARLPGPFACIHYQGNTSTDRKNLSHEEVAKLCDWLVGVGIVPVILDWDSRSPLPDQKRIFCPGVQDPLWQGLGTGDAETLAALIGLAKLFVGIDSGPQKVAFATETPTVAVWTGHHPLHYCDHAPNAIHAVPADHRRLLRGDKDKGLAYFEAHYQYVTYREDPVRSVVIPQARKILFGEQVKEDWTMLRTKVFDKDYYYEHLEAGLDYCGHGGWQEGYGRWLADALGLRGKKLLDVGCACGSIAAGLAKAGVYVSGCDCNEHMITMGRRQWLADQLKICDATNLHYWADGTFDCVHSNQVYEHLKPELVPFILREAARVTVPGGLLFAVLDTTEMYERQGRRLEDEDPTHTCVKPMAWWHEMLADNGWRLDQELWQAVVDHPQSYFRSYDWDGFVARKV